MQPLHPFIAVSIGAVIALSPFTQALSQPAPILSSKESDSTRDLADSDVEEAHWVETPRRIGERGVGAHSKPGLSKGSPVAQRESSAVDDEEAVSPDEEEPVIEAQTDVEPDAEPDTSSDSSETVPTEAIVDPDPIVDTPAIEVAPDASEATDPTESAPPNVIPSGTPLIPVESGATTAPEYLNPSPNPLQFPTRPQDVQIVGTQPITLQEAIDLAFRNNEALRVSRLELERAQAQLREAEAARLPNLNTGADLTVAENTQQDNPLSDLFGETEQDAADITLGGTLELTYDLFTGGRRSALIEANEQQVRFQELQVEAQEEELRLNVISDYYDLQEADEQVRIQGASVEEAEQSLRDAEALERAGVGTRFDVLQAQVELANSRQELTQSLSEQQIARRQLAQRLNLAQVIEVSAADPVEVANLWDLSLEDTIVLAYRNRAELEQQLIQREIAEAQRQAALADQRPQVSLFANYNLSDTLNQDREVTDQYQFGARFQLNLFDGGAARAAAAQQEANIEIAEAQFADSRNQVRFEVEQAYSTLQASFENIQTASLALEQATESLRLARLRFQAGVGTQSDVLEQQTALTNAEFNRLQAVLGYNRSLAQLQRAVSNVTRD